MINIEQLWRDYSKYEEASDPPKPLALICLPTYVCIWSFSCLTTDLLFHEQGINVHLAKKMIEDRSRDYMNARRVAKVRQVLQISTDLFESQCYVLKHQAVFVN